MKGDETVLELSEISNEWPDDNCFIKETDLKVDSKFKGTLESELKLEIKNKDGDNLKAELVDFKDNELFIDISDNSGEYFGIVHLGYTMVEAAVSPVPETIRLMDTVRN